MKKYLLVTQDGSRLFHSRESELTLPRMLPDRVHAGLQEFFANSKPGDYFTDENNGFLVSRIK